jgi:hypothetical protein
MFHLCWSNVQLQVSHLILGYPKLGLITRFTSKVVFFEETLNCGNAINIVVGRAFNCNPEYAVKRHKQWLEL